jgi:uncharacterized tellurite resistance protein B-like protein
MAILGIIAALIGAVSIALWRLNSAADAVRNVAGAAEDAHGLWRRFMWRKRLAKDRLELIKDPREAAAGMLVAVAQADGALTEREQAALIAEFRKTFEMTDPQAQELLAQARWTVGEVRDLDRCLFKLGQVLDVEQKRDVLALLESTAAVDGTPGPALRTSLDKYARTLKP